MCVLSINVFFTIGSQNRDLDALLPGNRSELRHASFWFSPKSGKSLLNYKKKQYIIAQKHPKNMLKTCAFLVKIHGHRPWAPWAQGPMGPWARARPLAPLWPCIFTKKHRFFQHTCTLNFEDMCFDDVFSKNIDLD